MDNPLTKLSRRNFLAASGAAVLVGCTKSEASPTQPSVATSASNAAATIPANGPTTTTHDMTAMPEYPTGTEKIAMLMYPEMTAIDLVGPQYFLSSLLGATVYLVAKEMTPVISDTGLPIMPTHTFQTCPPDIDILFVPGGTDGTLAAIEDSATLNFVKSRGATAKYVTSVCTGSVVLGAAGLLKGYNATSHWFTRDLLPNFGATPIEERVVIDRNRITAAGVSAGLDFGVTITALLRGEKYAKAMTLLAEYDPKPPYNIGNPKNAPEEKAALSEMVKEFETNAAAIAKKYAV